MNLANNLQLLRKEKGITQEQAAAVFGVSAQSVSKWETGVTCPDITLLPAIAEYYQVSIDELLGYKPLSSLNNIYLQINAFLENIKDDGELIDAIYRINRLSATTTSKQKDRKQTIDKLISGKNTNSCSMLQTYGDEFGGVIIHDQNSILVSSFKDYPELNISQIRDIYETLSRFADINTLKVLSAFFKGNPNIHQGKTLKEIEEDTKLTKQEIYHAMNNLDVCLNEEAKDERWFVTHQETLPLLMLLSMGCTLFK